MRVQILPWDPDHLVEMDAIFVNLEMEKQEVVSPSQTIQTPISRNEDLVNLKTKKGYRVNRVLIPANTGSGKSTLLANIAYKWAQPNVDGPLSEFELVFVISMHELRNANDSLEDVLFTNILDENSSVSKKGLKAYMKSHADKVLFLIDGLDEDSSGILGSTSEIFQILSNKTFKQSCVIATTHPDKLKDIGPSQSHYTKVKLLGFSDDNKKLYINKYFASDTNQGEELIKFLKNHHSLWQLAATPILLMFLCLLWEDQREEEDLDKKHLPETRTQLYQEIIECLWKRYHCKESKLPKKGLDDENFRTELKQLMTSLGLVALTGTFNSVNTVKVLFNESDFDDSQLFHRALKVGILTTERFRFKAKVETSVRFQHRSLQDFLAAVYLAHLQTDDKPLFDTCLDLYMTGMSKSITRVLFLSYEGWLLNMYDVLQFCCGYRPETTACIAEKYFDVCCRVSKNVEISVLLHLIFEAQLSHEQCKKLVPIFSTRQISVGMEWYPNHEKFIQYLLDLLQKVNDKSTSLLFGIINKLRIIHPIEFPRLLPLIETMLMHTNSLESLRLTFCLSSLQERQSPVFDTLFDVMSALKDLKQLSLACDEKGSSCSLADHNLSKLANLTALDLIGLSCSASAMARFLSENKHLKKLSIMRNSEHNISSSICFIKVTDDMMRELIKIKTLSQLVLDHVEIGRSVEHLQYIIGQLEFLVLSYAMLGEQDLVQLASFLPQAQNLIALDLSGNSITRLSLKSLAGQFKHMINLKSVTLDDNGLNNKDLTILIDDIKEMKSPLSHLQVLHNEGITLTQDEITDMTRFGVQVLFRCQKCEENILV